MDFFKQNLIPGEVVVQLLAFLCVFFLLKKMAWQPVLKSLEARREKIRDSFDEIEKTRKELDGLKSEYAARLQKIEDEARIKIQQAVEEGRKIARDIQDKARADAQQSFEKSKENLEMEIAKAKLTMKQEIANLALQVAEKVIEEKMSEKEQQAKALKMIEQLERSL